MRLPEHVIRRRQGSYLHLRLPQDLAKLTGRSHICRSLGTGDPRQARGLAAARVARMYRLWQEAREEMVATFRGKPFDGLGSGDVLALRADLPDVMAEIEAMPAEDRVRLDAVMDRILERLERENFDLRVEREIASSLATFGREVLMVGQTRGMGEVITLGAQAGKRLPPAESASAAHPEAQAPVPTLPARTQCTLVGAMPELGARSARVELGGDCRQARRYGFGRWRTGSLAGPHRPAGQLRRGAPSQRERPKP